ncbi:MAG: hypothetical protein OER22_14615 [Gammaproteobacteria bacterium]|nr:hypothetical protein [Gammaproteobacteria bacterium]MDH3553843.1 hypothetical protein [Gammaproteobacteria bacterium]
MPVCLGHLLIFLVVLPASAASQIRMTVGGHWNVSSEGTICILEYYVWDHPHDVHDHAANFMIRLLHFSESPRTKTLNFNDGFVPVLEDSLVVFAWPSLESTPVNSVSFDGQNNLMRPLKVQRIPNTTRAYFAFSTEDASRFIEAMSSEDRVTLNYVHEDGHSDGRAISKDLFSMKLAMFEACKADIAE